MTDFVREFIRFYCHHSPFDRGKYRLALWAYQNLRPPEAPILARLADSLLVELDLKEFIQSQIYYIGLYEHYLARYFQTCLSPGRIFVDVGAHVGQYTLLAAAAGMQAHAFEPDPHNFARLEAHVQLNRLDARLNRCAVADYTGRGTLYPFMDESIRSNSLRPIPSAPPSNRSQSPTRVIHLDGYLKGGHANVHLLKADVEGAELCVLRGAERILTESRPILILEVTEASARAYGYTPQELKRYLSGFGYRLFTIQRKTLKSAPVDRPEPYTNLICRPP